jgi:hypothetical protein
VFIFFDLGVFGGGDDLFFNKKCSILMGFNKKTPAITPEFIHQSKNEQS